MDIDDEYHSNNATNGFINHETVLFSSMTIRISNGHSLLDDDNNNNLIILDQNTNNNGCLILESAEMCDGMECDDNNHTMNIETNSYDVQKRDDQILIRILQFDRKLHVLKQQSHIEYAKKNVQHDKLLQEAFSLLAYPDPKLSPLAHLFEQSQRESVSSILNSAILQVHDMP